MLGIIAKLIVPHCLGGSHFAFRGPVEDRSGGLSKVSNYEVLEPPPPIREVLFLLVECDRLSCHLVYHTLTTVAAASFLVLHRINQSREDGRHGFCILLQSGMERFGFRSGIGSFCGSSYGLCLSLDYLVLFFCSPHHTIQHLREVSFFSTSEEKSHIQELTEKSGIQ